MTPTLPEPHPTLPELVEGRSLALVALLGASGLTHLLRPQVFDPLIPRALPGSARTWTYGSGVAELAVAAAVAVPATRRLGATAAAVLFIAVFPGNITMTVDAFRTTTSTGRRLATVLRLPLQLPLIAWAWRVRNA